MTRRTPAAFTALLLPALLASGCAAVGRSPARVAAERPGWSAELPELLPAIRTCLATTGGDAQGVTRAWPMAGDLAGVRLLRPGGDRLDCVAAADGRRVILTEAVVPGSRRADESTPLFTPPDREPPRGRCLATVPAVVGEERVGWLSFAACAGEDGAVAGTTAEAEAARPVPPRAAPTRPSV